MPESFCTLSFWRVYFLPGLLPPSATVCLSFEFFETLSPDYWLSTVTQKFLAFASTYIRYKTPLPVNNLFHTLNEECMRLHKSSLELKEIIQFFFHLQLYQQQKKTYPLQHNEKKVSCSGECLTFSLFLKNCGEEEE